MLENHDIEESKELELTKTNTITSNQSIGGDSKSMEVDLEQIKVTEDLAAQSQSSLKNWRILFQKKYRIAVGLSLGVPIAGQMSGINVIGAYSTTIFEEAGFKKAIIGSILMGVTNLIGTGISAAVFEKFNRRTLALFSFAGMGLSMIGVAFADLGKIKKTRF